MATTAPADTPQEPVVKTEVKVKGLPPGWRREVVVRKNGQSAGKTDVYYYSPCGKKFRSKPQIARFLGDHADLTVFDFSRAGTPGDGSSRRRARDRSSRRTIEVAKQGPPPIRPLSINPLRPSGPIRRTCGVIKLPVTWVPQPCEDKLSLSTATAAAVNHPQQVSAEPMDTDSAPSTTTTTTTTSSSSSSSTSSSTSSAVGPAVPPAPAAAAAPPRPPPLSPAPGAPLGGSELTQIPPKSADQPQPAPQAQPQQLQQTQQPHQVPPTPRPPPTSVVMVPALWENRLSGVVPCDYETGNEIRIPPPPPPEKLQNGLSHSPLPAVLAKGADVTKEGVSLDKSALSSLLNKQLHGKVVGSKIEDKKHLATSLSTGSVVPSLLSVSRQQQQQQQQRHQGMLTTVVPSLKTIKENGSLAGSASQVQKKGLAVLTLPTVASTNAYKAGKPHQRQSIKTVMTAPVRSVPSSSSSSSSKAAVMAGPGAPLSPGGGVYVSETELRRQEEKVQLLRKQLMAAQSTV